MGPGSMVFPYGFFHIVRVIPCDSHVSAVAGFSQHDLRELHAFFEVEKTSEWLRKEMSRVPARHWATPIQLAG